MSIEIETTCRNKELSISNILHVYRMDNRLPDGTNTTVRRLSHRFGIILEGHRTGSQHISDSWT